MLSSRPQVRHLWPVSAFLRDWPMGPPFIRGVQTGVLNYVIVRPCTAVAAFSLGPLGLYHPGSLDPRDANPYIALANSVSQVRLRMKCNPHQEAATRVWAGAVSILLLAGVVGGRRQGAAGTLSAALCKGRRAARGCSSLMLLLFLRGGVRCPPHATAGPAASWRRW